MLILYSLPLLFLFSFAGASAVNQHLKTLKNAIELYNSYPLRISSGSIIISDPDASGTHTALSKLLAKYPTKNGLWKSSIVNVLADILEVAKPESDLKVISKVETSLGDIIEKCQISFDLKHGDAGSWSVSLNKVGEIFAKNAPPGTNAELKTQNDEYKFMIFLLMHWKLEYGRLSLGKASTTKQVIGTVKQLPSNNNSSKPNANTGQDQLIQYTTFHVPSGFIVDSTTDLNALFAAYPEESRRPPSVGVNVTQPVGANVPQSVGANVPRPVGFSVPQSVGANVPQSVGVNVAQTPKRKAHPSSEEPINKKQKVNEYESRDSAVAPATGNSSNSNARGNSTQDWNDAMDELLDYYASF